MVVVLMHLQVLSQLLDASGQDSDLDFGGTGVVFVGLVCLDDGRLFFFADHGISTFLEFRCPQG